MYEWPKIIIYSHVYIALLHAEIDDKIERVLYVGSTKREGNIWHNLGGNTIILFFNINNEYMNNKLIY